MYPIDDMRTDSERDPHRDSDFRMPYLDDNSSRRDADRGRSFLKAARILFTIALFLLPFVFIPIIGWDVAVGKVVVVTLLFLSGGIAVFASLFKRKKLALPRTYSALLLGIFAMATLSLVFSESLAASFLGTGLEVGTFFTVAVAILVALITPLIITSKQGLVHALYALFLGGAVLGIFHVLRLFLGSDFLTFNVFFMSTSTPIGLWNDLGIFFGVLYLISLAMLASIQLPFRARALLTVSLVVSLAFVILVNFQLLSIILALTTLVLLVALFLSRREHAIFAVSTSLVVLVLAGIFTVPIGNFLGTRLDVSYVEIRPNWLSTVEMLGVGLSDVKNVVVGSGPNTFIYLWQEERAQAIIDSDFWAIDFAFSSGILPTFMVMFGLITVALLIMLAVYVVLKLFAVMRSENADPTLVSFAVASGIGALFLFVLSIVYVFSVANFIIMFILFGVFVAALHQMNALRMFALSPSSRIGPSLGAIGVVACIMFIVPALVMSASRTMYGQGIVMARQAQGVEEVIRAQGYIRQASILERNDAFARIETELGIVRIQEFLAREQIDEEDNMPFQRLVIETQQAADRALRINPRNYLNHVNIGIVYEVLGLLGVEDGFDFAAQSYARARELNPTNPELMLIQARLERAREDSAAARAFVDDALALKSNYANAYILLADMYVAEDDTPGAIQVIQRGIEAAPRSALLPFRLGLIHYAEEDFTEAIGAFSQAIRLDPQYANARYFRALSYVYGHDNREEALQDLEFILEANADNQVLQVVIANIRAGRDPLDGVAEDDPGFPDPGALPGTNIEAIDALDAGRAPDQLPLEAPPVVPPPAIEETPAR
jgi:tetratricopeptide (TPR) repeat protein